MVDSQGRLNDRSQQPQHKPGSLLPQGFRLISHVHFDTFRICDPQFLIDDSLNQVGAIRTFNNLLASYQRIPLAPKVDADITEHVLAEGLSGIFYYVAREEKAIRDNPLKRTTELLQRVFGSQ